ncbi:MAG: hypothetical protein HC862_24780 [Scytonema sp. RU_4_4]|nr:hypothetical protein [Scytonema sp. RU_4_4]
MSTYLQGFFGIQIVGRNLEGDEALHHIIAKIFGEDLAQEFLDNIRAAKAKPIQSTLVSDNGNDE